MDGKVVIGVELNSKDLDRQIEHLTDYLKNLEDEYNDISNMEPFEDQAKQLRKMSAEIVSTKKKLASLNKEKDRINKEGMENFVNSLKGTGNSLNKIISKVVHWSLAVFGVRSAYLAVRQAASTLAEYNEQISTDLEYIRFALASALQPIVEGLIRLVYKLLSLLNSISIALFNYPLFANATAKAFNKTAKSAEKIKKSLAGFDEMNVLQDTSGGDASGGGATPSMDLSKIDEQTTQFVEKMKGAINTVTSFWEEDWKKYFDNASGEFGVFIKGLLLTLKGFYDIFKGIFEIIGGVIDIFVGIFTGDIEKIKQGWDKVVRGFVDILKGILEIIIGIILSVVGIIIGIVKELINAIVFIIKGIITILGEIVNWIYQNVILNIVNFFIWLFNTIKEGVSIAWNFVLGILSGIANWIFNNIIKPISNFFSGLFEGIKNGFQSAVNFIKNIFNSVVTFFKGIISTIFGLFKTVGTKVGEIIGGAFKAVVNGVLGAVESILNTPIRAINKLISTINKIPGISLGKLSTFNLPRLAKGGIINMPGRGVPIGGAIAGERGQEGVIPLTDSQQMMLLGEAIGRYITINANITNTMNGRVISRELQKINNESDFAFNR